MITMEKVIKIYKKLSKKLKAKPLFYGAVVIASILLVFAIAQSRAAIKSADEELQQLRDQCEQQEIENNALRELLENSDSEYIERKAREELDYVFPGERVYVVRSGNQ